LALKAFATHYGVDYVPQEALGAKNFLQTGFSDLMEQHMLELWNVSHIMPTHAVCCDDTRLPAVLANGVDTFDTAAVDGIIHKFTVTTNTQTDAIH